MFSQTAEYALRAVVWLADNSDGGPVGHGRIAEETRVPPTYLAKVLQSLAKAKIVTSRRGVRGGFVLSKEPAKLTVLEVVNAVDPIRRITGCPLKLKMHRKRLCSMHSKLDSAIQQVEQMLGSSTISDILTERASPKPMVNQIIS